jgi:hypothetical protein
MGCPNNMMCQEGCPVPTPLRMMDSISINYIELLATDSRDPRAWSAVLCNIATISPSQAIQQGTMDLIGSAVDAVVQLIADFERCAVVEVRVLVHVWVCRFLLLLDVLVCRGFIHVSRRYGQSTVIISLVPKRSSNFWSQPRLMLLNN